MIEESKEEGRNERKINEDGKWYRKAKKKEEMRERLMRMVSDIGKQRRRKKWEKD